MISDQHNHPMFPGTTEYSRSALKLNPNMATIVQECTVAGLRMPDARKMLQSKYPERYFNGKTITNAMVRFKFIDSSPNSNNPNRRRPISNNAMDLTRLLNEKKQFDDWFVATDINEVTGQLNKVFWMDREQMILYRRYHDVVLNDTTAQTNPFGMPLNVTVVIDNSGASRVVALALTRSEGRSDYKWVLRQIMAACGGCAPRVLVVDEDKAMESASLKVFPDVRIVNCIWHMDQNFRKFVGTHFRSKKDESQELLSGFQLAKDALTVHEFEDVWSRLMRKYGSSSKKQGDSPQECGNQKSGDQESGDRGDEHEDPKAKSKRCHSSSLKIKNHLQRLYDRRFHWARPWTGTCFTAGVRSTQRVEKAHHLIKRLGSW